MSGPVKLDPSDDECCPGAMEQVLQRKGSGAQGRDRERYGVINSHSCTLGCALRTRVNLHRGAFSFSKNKRLHPLKLLPNGFTQLCFWSKHSNLIFENWLRFLNLLLPTFRTGSEPPALRVKSASHHQGGHWSFLLSSKVTRAARDRGRGFKTDDSAYQSVQEC